jgi:hypothetical protein
MRLGAVRFAEFGTRLGTCRASGLAAAGLCLGVVATATHSEALVVLAAVPFGSAYGMCLVAGLRETERLAPAHERGASVAIFLALSYLGFTVPYVFQVLAGSVGAQAALLPLTAVAAVSASAVA